MAPPQKKLELRTSPASPKSHLGQLAAAVFPSPMQGMQLSTLTITIPLSIGTNFEGDCLQRSWERLASQKGWRKNKGHPGFLVKRIDKVSTLQVKAEDTVQPTGKQTKFKNCNCFKILGQSKIGVKLFKQTMHLTGVKDHDDLLKVMQAMDVLEGDLGMHYDMSIADMKVNMAKWDFNYYDLPQGCSINLQALCGEIADNMSSSSDLRSCTVIYDPTIYAGANLKVPLYEMAGYTQQAMRNERDSITLAKENYENFKRLSKRVMEGEDRTRECKRQRQQIRSTEKRHLSLATFLIWASGKGTLVLPWASLRAECYGQVVNNAVRCVQDLQRIVHDGGAKLVNRKVKVNMYTREQLDRKRETRKGRHARSVLVA